MPVTCLLSCRPRKCSLYRCLSKVINSGHPYTAWLLPCRPAYSDPRNRPLAFKSLDSAPCRPQNTFTEAEPTSPLVSGTPTTSPCRPMCPSIAKAEPEQCFLMAESKALCSSCTYTLRIFFRNDQKRSAKSSMQSCCAP